MGPAGTTGAAGAATLGAGFCAGDCAITVNGTRADTNSNA